MNKLLQILLFFSLVTQLCYSQWNQQNSGTTAHLNDIYFINNTTGWIVGNNGTVLKTINAGADWNVQTSNTSLNLTAVHFINSNIGWAVGDTLCFIKTTNGGINWTPINLNIPMTNLTDLYFLNESTGFITGLRQYSSTGYDSYFGKTTDGGLTWSFDGVLDGKLFAVFFANSNIGWMAGTHFIKTTNGGLSWNYPPGFNFTPVPNIFDMYFVNESTGWMAGNAVELFSAQYGIILKTSDGGESWNTVYSDSSKRFNSVYFRNENTGWCTGDAGVIMYTTNGGINWTNQQSGVNESLKSVFFPVDNIGWIAGTSGKVLHTINSGTPVEFVSFTAEAVDQNILLKWTTASETNNSGFEVQRSTDNITFREVGFVPGAGTSTESTQYSFKDESAGAGKYQYRLKQIDFNGSYNYSAIIEYEHNLIYNYSLRQNYPNPFNPSTVIAYSISEKSNVSLIIYNALGSEVAVLVNEEKPEGNYSVEVNAGSLSSGVYFYQLKVSSGESNRFTDTKKMVLIR